MRILCRVPLVARNWARRKSETIMYIEMSLPPGKRRAIESTVYHLYLYIHIVTFSQLMCAAGRVIRHARERIMRGRHYQQDPSQPKRVRHLPSHQPLHLILFGGTGILDTWNTLAGFIHSS